MENNMKEEPGRRRSAAWTAFGSPQKATDQLANSKLRAHLLDSTVLPALSYAAETWPDTSLTSRLLRTTQERLNDVFSDSVGVHNICPACVAQIFRVYSIFVTQSLYIYSGTRMGRSYTKRNGRQMYEENCEVDSTTMYASSKTTTYTLGGRVR
ncbi:hypothetical protein KIN20_001232 [Parelaphostrongylus tenuis]|uniref:Uncharacterized protein n=1 Tax=Parelaphostrongylus tenuis TaxID=148309 RepID=A0AAD5QGU1_PARTN|nr:hypothetical protein KIN20_001232 [Parelaphostrongylus tenuis]